MTNIQKDMRAYLLTKSEVTNLLGTSTSVFYPGDVSQGATFPILIVSIITGTSTQHQGGHSGVGDMSLQFDCYAKLASVAIDVIDAVRTVVADFSGTLGGGDVVQASGDWRWIGTGFEALPTGSQTQLHRATGQISVVHAEDATV